MVEPGERRLCGRMYREPYFYNESAPTRGALNDGPRRDRILSDCSSARTRRLGVNGRGERFGRSDGSSACCAVGARARAHVEARTRSEDGTVGWIIERGGASLQPGRISVGEPRRTWRPAEQAIVMAMGGAKWRQRPTLSRGILIGTGTHNYEQ